MEMIHHRLIAWDRLEVIAAGEVHHRLTRGIGRLWTGEKVDRHALPRSWRGVVEREVFRILRDVFTVRLTDPKPVLRVGVLAIPDIAQIGIDLSREEERMRRRNRRKRSS